MDAKYIEFAKTEIEKITINAILSEGSQRKAAKLLGKSKSTVSDVVSRVKRRASLQGYAPENDMVHVAPDSHFVKGTSTLYKNGKQALQWVKTDKKAEDQFEIMKSAVQALVEDITPKTAYSYDEIDFDDDVIPWFQIGDGHIGMLAHHEEVGHNFDLKIAEEELSFAMGKMINEAPNCERAVIQDLGDFTHYFNMEGHTQSGHLLDFDTRFHKMIKVYVRLLERVIDFALEKFKYVDVIINQGNHSRTNDFWAVELLKALYKDQDRLSVLDNTNVFIPYRMGNTFVMSHHSDKCKPARLVDVMATDYAEDWGEAEYRYIDIGHIHHKTVAKEMAGVTVESWNQLAPADKYAHEGGWRSRSSLTCVYRSKTYGEIGRKTLPVEQVKDLIDNLSPGSTAQKRRKVHTV